ncbi:hypothetical protein T36_0221 [Helicobacter cinaedi]|uniref:putative barnase/colicin E5 family endoribonuclease n=1 Tax=Helicobacter cinaedi TaxID=213 RepID=UPI001F3CA068|nr:hypothetical protein [Helicobacter cinaedi]BDB63777.1 hypothetical protein T36_0221 [Helicobacter cinaedi]
MANQINAHSPYDDIAKSNIKLDSDIIPQSTLNGDSITNPDISYAIKNKNITKELAEKIANGEIDNIRKRGDINIADVRYYDKDNMTMYFANIGNYIDDDLGMKGDRFFLNNINKNEFYIPPTKSLQDFKEQSLNQIEFLKKAIKTEIDNVRDEKELHKNIREIKLKARENAEKRLFDDAIYKEHTQAREFYTTQYDEAMQEMKNYYDKNFTNILNEIDFNAPTKQAKTQMPKDNPQLVALQTKIQEAKEFIAKSKNPDKEYLHHTFKPDEIIQLEKQYFNQAMPQEYKELIQDFPRLYEQSLANELKTYAKDTDTIQEVTTNLLNDFKDKPFKDTAKNAENLLINTLRDKAKELGFKELDVNKPSFKVAFGKFQAKLKKGDIQDLSEHIATSSLRKNRLRIQEELNIKPLVEFGTNYAEHYHSGETAIQKLINEAQAHKESGAKGEYKGQVAGAFHRKELGDIDLVWGEVTDFEKHKGYGLAHIIDKRKSEFMQKGLSEAEAEAKAMELINNIPNIISKGKIIRDEKGRLRIELDNQILGIKDNWHGMPTNKWIITTYEPRESAGSLYTSPTITKGETLPLNSSDIIPQQKDYLQNKLRGAGFDSIQLNDNIIVVFDSNQIKHIDNKGVDGKFFNESSPNIYQSNAHLGSGLVGGSVAGIEQDENGNVSFSPEKFALGLLGGAVGSKAVSSGKYAIMRRMEARKNDKKLYNVFRAIDSSAKYGSKMNLIGKENLNADTLAYALAKNKRFAINKLDENTAKVLGFKYPQDVRRSIDPSDVIHTLNRHGIDSNLVKLSGQKPVTLDEIAKYQYYADNATHKGVSKGKRQESVSVSANQLDSEFYVIIEQIRKGQNELGFKTMYFERGILDDEKFNKLLKD